MNWYKQASVSKNPQHLEFLLAWMSESPSLIKEAQVWTSNSGGWSMVDKKRDAQIVKYFDDGKTPAEIMQLMPGATSNNIRNVLIRNQRIQPKIKVPQTGRGMTSDETIINKVREMTRTINPQTGKNYNKSQIAKFLGVSYQTVDRIMAKHVRTGQNDVANFVAYKFWETYHSGMQAYLSQMPENQRMGFINKFIDTIFQAPSDRQSAKEALYHKLDFRNRMMGVGKKQPASPIATPFIDRNQHGTPNMTNNNAGIATLNPNVPAPVPNNAYMNRQEALKGTTVTQRYQKAGKGAILKTLIKRYQSGESFVNLSRELGISVSNARAIIEEAGIPIRSSQRMNATPVGAPMPPQTRPRQDPLVQAPPPVAMMQPSKNKAPAVR